MTKAHSFHIPVMGIGFTVDTPLKVAQYGIDSVIFISDDILLEKLRKMYCEKFEKPYIEITEKIDDFRARRITSYLNLIKDLAEEKFEELKSNTLEKGSELKKYFSMLPDSSSIKDEFFSMADKIPDVSEMKGWLKDNLPFGDINVNIMTKLDKTNYKKDEELPVEFNDAHAALRGFANSNLESSMIFSAGMNPRLFGYIEKFDDFFPNVDGYIKKKIVLKVSDYRSAIIQGKYLAKKGIWVSEYRVESGLNCGGHAFATEGYLMGPILQEFKANRDELVDSISDVLFTALESKGKVIPKEKLSLRITAQGGVGTSEEHDFLIDNYGVDSVGWGSPFLLVPEVTNVDDETRTKLCKAKEEDLFLSDISPLGVPFNNLRGNSKDMERDLFKAKGRPGSACPKKFLALGKLDGKPICSASRLFQHIKLKELEDTRFDIGETQYQKEYTNLTAKSCLCVGLGASAMVVNDMERKVEGDAVSVCPGPNLAYFSEKRSLKEMVGHIYEGTEDMVREDRPHMFVKELGLYLDFLKTKIDDVSDEMNRKQIKYFKSFTTNLDDGISYYKDLFSTIKDKFEVGKTETMKALNDGVKSLNEMKGEIEELMTPKVLK